MEFLSLLFVFIVSFVASVVGAICGIGGGVIIKPVLDMMGFAGIATISFLSGCMVLSMSFYSVCKSALLRQLKVHSKTGGLLAAGAAAGGVLGKQLFAILRSSFENANAVGCIQAICLGIVTLGTIVYMFRHKKIQPHNVTNSVACVVIGLLLGVLSSFLGIGGGPVNLVVLLYFFGMDNRTAAQNSLFIILCSQFASLLTTLLSGSVPAFDPLALVLMVTAGIAGGALGHMLHGRLHTKTAERLLFVLLFIIVGISVFNAVQYGVLI